MTKTSSCRCLVVADPVMFGETGQSELEDHLAGALRPAVLLLGLFEILRLGANIDQHACRAVGNYDLNRHLGLLSAYKGELAGLNRLKH
jgi:hypothetical protein